MIYNIIPFEGSEQIKLGMTTDEIKAIKGVDPERFNKACIEEPVDLYDDLLVYYDGSKTCYQIDFTLPAQVYLNGFLITGKPMQDVLKHFSTLDDDLRFDIINGFVSLKYEIGIYAENMNVAVESVSVAQKGIFAAYA